MPDRIGKARSQMTRYRRLGRGGECCARACNDFRARRNGKGLRRQALRKCVEGPRHLSCRTQPGTDVIDVRCVAVWTEAARTGEYRVARAAPQQ
jgi:hypothetical protein